MPATPLTDSPASGGRPYRIRTYGTAQVRSRKLVTWLHRWDGTWRVSEIQVPAQPLTTQQFLQRSHDYQAGLDKLGVSPQDDRRTWNPLWNWSRVLPTGSDSEVEQIVETWLTTQ